MVRIAPKSWLAVSAALLSSAAAVPAFAQADGQTTLAYDYLIQDVCVDNSGKALGLDPYRCPAGDMLRPLKPGEALPYHKNDQTGGDASHLIQRRDSFPAVARDGGLVVTNPYDHAPFDVFKDGQDGYDITLVRNGWVSIGGTRTSTSPGTTFFGSGCQPYNGWILFPVSSLRTGAIITPGEKIEPLKAVHWQEQGQSWPGACPADYNSNTLTSWEPLPKFVFGGADPSSQKQIDAIRSVHGFTDSPGFAVKGHMEVFYFTRLYGFTRWESWAPQERMNANSALADRGADAKQRCSGTTSMQYHGMTFYRIACRDWTAISVPAKPEPVPVWPNPYL
jgi:hypothetical protein